MRTLMILALLTVSSPAWAQPPAIAPSAIQQGSLEAPVPCLTTSHIDKVIVATADRGLRKGSLLCLGVDELVLAEPTGVARFHMHDVLKIRKAADPVWDGALKGAAFALVPLVFGCPAECVFRSAASYGLLGLAIDAVDTNRDTIYRSSTLQQGSAGFRVRF